MKKIYIIPAIIVIAIAAFVYFFQIKGSEWSDKTKEQSEKIFGYEKDSVQSIQIQSSYGIYKFVRNQNGWQIEEPVKTMADQSTINSMLNSLSGAKKIRTFEIKVNERSSYGLGSAGIRIISQMIDGVRDTLYLGQDVKIESDIYASRIDTVLYQTSSSIKTDAEKSLFEWRDKNVIHFNKDKVRSFIIVNPHGKFEFSKGVDGWKLLSPMETIADERSVEAILNNLNTGQIKTVACETASNLRKYKLSQPAYRVDLICGDDKTRAAIILSAAKDSRIYGKEAARSYIFEVDTTFIKPFKADLFKLRNKKIFDFNVNEVDGVNLLYQGKLITILKDVNNNWSLLSGEKISDRKANDLLRKIRNLQADRFIQENPTYFMNFGLVNPEGKIEIFINNEKIAELNIGYQKKGLVYVYNPHSKPLMAIEEDKLKYLFPDKSELIEEVKNPVTTEDAEE